ncbi:MAG TPA: SMP-30/gluconolactonase/LRE family protein [Terriglobia bacterium]|jgi:gluconolactonase
MDTKFVAVGALSIWSVAAGLIYAQQGQVRPAQERTAREVTVTAIPDVIDADAKWGLVWQGTDNADGIVGTKDGGLLFAQEQPSTVRKLDKNDKDSVYVENTHGAGALAIDDKGRVLAVERTCTDPGSGGAACSEPTAIAVIYPEEARRTIIDNFEGKSLGRLNDLVVDKDDTIYFTSGTAYYVTTRAKRNKLKLVKGKEEIQINSLGPDLRTNGIMLSPDERILYVTNGQTIMQFDIQLNGYVNNRRLFAKLQDDSNGDGMAIDEAGRLYVTAGPGVQVFSPQGNYLGTIPTPRNVISAAFSGKEKRTLYVVGSGALGPDGKEVTTPEGVRNNAKTIYKIQMVAAGFKGRAK